MRVIEKTYKVGTREEKDEEYTCKHYIKFKRLKSKLYTATTAMKKYAKSHKYITKNPDGVKTVMRM